jgi:erythromycin esterase-like protein
VSKRISHNRSRLFWLLVIAGAFIIYNHDHLRQLTDDYKFSNYQSNDYRSGTPHAQVQSVQDTTNDDTNVKTVEHDRLAVMTLPELIYDSSEHFSDIDSANLDGLLKRIGDSRLVLIGEASHGTAEFYDMRARITRELIEKKGFNIVAVEADWPDATSINYFIRGSVRNPGNSLSRRPIFKNKPFSGFPSWMWKNHSVIEFTRWLKDYNQRYNSPREAVGFYGLDLYNLFGSIEAVLDYLRDVDPRSAEVAAWRYACLMPWANDPSDYSRVMRSQRFHRGCEYEVASVLQALIKNKDFYIRADEQRFFGALQNARLVTKGERYYRTMYYANNSSWNQRDQNMFDTLQATLKFRGETSKAVVWAHNSHIGDARATEMSSHGDFNLGQRVRETFGSDAYLIGFGTDHGTVIAASKWGGKMKVMKVQTSQAGSYERLLHEVKSNNFLLPLRKPIKDKLRVELLTERLQRAIGTTYDPKDELKKHYIYASLPQQFDEYIWFDETQAVKPLSEEITH